MLGYVWSLWENNVALNQLHSDWYVLSWAAKWLGEADVMYQDQRFAANIEDDGELLHGIWNLLDAADIVVTQNGRAFDQKKLFARFIINGFKPPSSFKHVDTKVIAKRHFGFTSNKLEYLAEKLCARFRKLKHQRYPGFDLWRACLAGDQKAWEEMERYNRQDVLALEELYLKLHPWDNSVNHAVYYEAAAHVCRCGSRAFKLQGYAYTATGKYQRYRCKSCGAESRDRTNLLSDEKRATLRVETTK